MDPGSTATANLSDAPVPHHGADHAEVNGADHAEVDTYQAQYDSIFSCTRGNPRGYGRLPPHKQPRLSPDSGFNSLSEYKKCQLLTYAKVATATMLPHNLKMLLEADKADRLSWFNTHLFPTLKNRDAEAFAGFHYTADFVDLICTVELTAPFTDNWWDSPFVGGQLYRNKEDIQHLNRLHRTRGNTQMQLQVNPQQLGVLSSKAPVPITTMPDLLSFLKRVWHCTTLFFPAADLGYLARDIYQALLEQQRPLSRDPAWLAIKPGEIIHRLQQANNAEFSHFIPLADILEGNFTGCYKPPNHANVVSQCLAPGATIAQGFLPLELRQRPAPGTPGTPRATGSTGPTTSRPAAGATRPNTRTGPAPAPPQPAPPQQAHTNAHYHPNFKAFWNSRPANQRQPITGWLRGAGTTTNQMLDTLGLSPNDCGTFHHKGTCYNPSCARQHTSKVLDPVKVDAVVAMFHAGIQHTS